MHGSDTYIQSIKKLSKMKTTAEKKFENLQKALEYLTSSDWGQILSHFGLDKSLNMENTIVNFKIKSVDEKGCNVILSIKFP